MHTDAPPFPLLTPALARAAEQAAVALVRYDERLARIDAALAAGALRRAEIADAQASVGLGGGVAPLEDIVLNDAGMDSRTPTGDVVRAVAQLNLRRAIERRDPDMLLDPVTIGALLGLPALPSRERPAVRSSPRDWDEEADDDDFLPDEEEPLDPGFDDADQTNLSPALPPATLKQALAEADALLARSRRPLASYNEPDDAGGAIVARVRDPLYNEPERLAAWLRTVEETEVLPAACAAAVALDRWLWLEPSERSGEAGFLLAAALLRRRGLTANHLPALARSFRRGRFRWGPHQDQETRLRGLLAALEGAASLGAGDIDRLSIAQDLLLRRCSGRSKNSRLPALAALFVASPLVTVQMAAKSLSVTPQAVEAMLKELGPSLPRELTGRRRYRAWGIL